MTTYKAWDEKDYQWPPPEGWYSTAEGIWWPQGHGPGPDSPQAAAPQAAPPVAGPAAIPVTQPVPQVAPPAMAPTVAPPVSQPIQTVPSVTTGFQTTEFQPARSADEDGFAGSPVMGDEPASKGSGGKVLALLAGLGLVGLVAIGAIFALGRGEDTEAAETVATTIPVATVPGVTDAPTTSPTTTSTTAANTETSETAEPGEDVSVFSLVVNDCYGANSDDEVNALQAVSCAEEHESQVYAVFDVLDATYPGAEVVGGLADDGCLERFEAYVGKDYQSSVFDIQTLIPTQETWDANGDREIVCLLVRIDGNANIGTAESSGL